MKGGKLTPKQQRFVREYVIDLNGAQAAIRAGYSARCATEQGHRLLTYAHVQAAIEKQERKIAGKLEITQERVLAELGRIAFLDPRQFFDNAGRMRHLVDADADLAAVVAGMDVAVEYAGMGEDRMAVGEVRKIRFADKIRSLELLGKHLKVFDRRGETPGADARPVINVTLGDVRELTREELLAIIAREGERSHHDDREVDDVHRS